MNLFSQYMPCSKLIIKTVSEGTSGNSSPNVYICHGGIVIVAIYRQTNKTNNDVDGVNVFRVSQILGLCCHT